MNYLPINLRLGDRPVLVVGGGAIALQKVVVLRANGARVRVVAGAVLKKIMRMPDVEVLRRDFEESDLDQVAFVIAATDDAAINVKVHTLARRHGLLVNVVDDSERCDFIFPSILRRGELSVAVSTSGAGPALARMLREDLEPEFVESFGAALRWLRQERARARALIVCPGARRAVAETLSRMVAQSRRQNVEKLREKMRAAVDEIAALESRKEPETKLIAVLVGDHSR